MSGKGHAPRPFDIPRQVYESNHARIFGAPKPREQYIPPPVKITNNGSQCVFVKVGTGSIAASAKDLPINPGDRVIVEIPVDQQNNS